MVSNSIRERERERERERIGGNKTFLRFTVHFLLILLLHRAVHLLSLTYIVSNCQIPGLAPLT